MSMPNRKFNTPSRVSTAMPTTKPPTQMAMPDAAVTITDNAFHNAFPMSFNVITISSIFLDCYSFHSDWEGRVLFLFVSPYVRSFLVPSSTASVVFVSGASQRLGSRISKFFRQNTTPERAWRFFDKKFEFLIPSLPLPQATKMTPDAVLDGGMETEAYA